MNQRLIIVEILETAADIIACGGSEIGTVDAAMKKLGVTDNYRWIKQSALLEEYRHGWIPPGLPGPRLTPEARVTRLTKAARRLRQELLDGDQR